MLKRAACLLDVWRFKIGWSAGQKPAAVGTGSSVQGSSPACAAQTRNLYTWMLTHLISECAQGISPGENSPQPYTQCGASLSSQSLLNQAAL